MGSGEEFVFWVNGCCWSEWCVDEVRVCCCGVVIGEYLWRDFGIDKGFWGIECWNVKVKRGKDCFWVSVCKIFCGCWVLGIRDCDYWSWN